MTTKPSFGAVAPGSRSMGRRVRGALERFDVLYGPYDVVLHSKTPIDIELGGVMERDPEENGLLDGGPQNALEGFQSRFAFVCHGTLNPAPALGDAIRLHGGVSPYVDVRIEGGGKDVETDTAIHVYDVKGGMFGARARMYDGTVCRFDLGPGDTKGDNITAEFSVGRVHTHHCGQSLSINTGNAGPVGEIRDVFDVSPVRGPEFRLTPDTSINQYENYMAQGRTERGVGFDRCVSIWADKILVGGAADTPPFEFKDSQHVFLNVLHLGGSPTHGTIFENVHKVTAQVITNQIQGTGVVYRGINTDSNRMFINAANSGRGLVIDESIGEGDHYVSGNFKDNTGTDIEVGSTDAEIHPNHVYAPDGGELPGGGAGLVLPEENQVHLTQSRIASIEGTPKTTNQFGQTRADAETPDTSNWRVGDFVVFTDTEDGSGDGLYVKVPNGSWREISLPPPVGPERPRERPRNGRSAFA